MYRNQADKQRGFLLPVALFIIVIMGMFALTLWRTSAQTSMASVQEIHTVQAFFAAETGGQRGMSALFFPDSSDRQAIDARCGAMNITLDYVATGLSSCEAQVTCTCVYENAAICDAATGINYTLTGPVVKSFYKLTSTSLCGSGNYAATRTLAVGAFTEQQ